MFPANMCKNQSDERFETLDFTVNFKLGKKEEQLV